MQVWALTVYVTVLDHGGNLTDACFLAAVAALKAFRRPDASVDAATSTVIVHPTDVREPLALSLHHTPIATTFANFEVRAQKHPVLSSAIPVHVPSAVTKESL